MKVCRPSDYRPGTNAACDGHEVIVILEFAGNPNERRTP